MVVCFRLQHYYRRRSPLAALVAIAVVFGVVVVLRMGQNVDKKATSDLAPNKSNEVKLVLVWTKFFLNTNWVTNEHFKYCPINSCQVTEDKGKFSASHALLFHERDMKVGGQLILPTAPRPQDQRWVWLTQETYMSFDQSDLSEYNNLFNWTMTYRRDSDVIIAYGAVKKRETLMDKAKFDQSVAEDALKRTKLVAMRISNCDTSKTDRMNYVKKLKEYIPVDILGACGEQCDQSKNNCDNDFMKKYKFYLAFENSHCTDYITEKFWLPLEFWHNVPVVMGGSSRDDYQYIAPPHSYIHVEWYKSPKELADYLMKLDKDEVLYNQYFQWRRTHVYDFPGYCYLCAALHDRTLPRKSYGDLTGWYQNDKCSNEHPRYV